MFVLTVYSFSIFGCQVIAAAAWCWNDCEVIPHVQGQRSPIKIVGTGAVAARFWGHFGDTPFPRAKEKPQQDGRRGEIEFRIKPLTCQRCSEGSNKPCAHQDPEIPQTLRQNCV